MQKNTGEVFCLVDLILKGIGGLGPSNPRCSAGDTRNYIYFGPWEDLHLQKLMIEI